MTIYFVPSRFNSMPQESRVLGNTFNVYATHTYSGHERVEAMIKHDRRDAELMSIWRYRRAKGYSVGNSRHKARCGCGALVLPTHGPRSKNNACTT